MEHHVLAWDASGTQGCSGTPRLCTPLLDRTIEFEEFFDSVVVSEPVIANGVVYVTEPRYLPSVTALSLPRPGTLSIPCTTSTGLARPTGSQAG